MKLDNVLYHSTAPARLHVGYHITIEPNLNSILKHGLQPKSGNNNYQYLTPRIFLTDNVSSDTLERVGSIVLIGGRNAQEMESSPPNHRLVVKVDLSGWSHEVFVDNVMKMKGCYYTTHTIPSERITFVWVCRFC